MTDHHRQRDPADSDDRRDHGQGDARVAGEHADREADPDQRQRSDVRRARQQKERHRLVGDLVGRHPTAPQRPGPQRQAAGAADRKQRVGAELGHRDLVARAPTHARAENHPERDHVRERRRDLKDTADDDPPGGSAVELVTQPAQPRYERDRDDRDDDQRAQPPQGTPHAPGSDRRRQRRGIKVRLDRGLCLRQSDITAAPRNSSVNPSDVMTSENIG